MALSYTKTAIALGELAAAFDLEGDTATADAFRRIADKPAAHMRLTNMLNDPAGVDRTATQREDCHYRAGQTCLAGCDFPRDADCKLVAQLETWPDEQG